MASKAKAMLFAEKLRQEGVPEGIALDVVRLARRHTRYAEQECNGEGMYDPAWYDRGETCKRCETKVRPQNIKRRHGVCDCCVVEQQITALLAPYAVVPKFSGDPRGATVKLKVPSGRTDDWGQEGVCVP